jgi:putative ABC transport system substrate-binding protein
MECACGCGNEPAGGNFLPDHAIYVDKIFKGAKPGERPVEQSATFELLVNGKAAKALGLTIPQSVLLRADRVTDGA